MAYILVGLTSEKGYARIVGYAGVNIIVGIIIFILNVKKGKKFFIKNFGNMLMGLIFRCWHIIFHR